MSLISLHQVSLNIAGNQLLDAVDWQIHAQERIALVGRNGAGKSSLMRLLIGELTPDKGRVQRLNQLRIGGLTQMIPRDSHDSVYHYLVKGLGAIGDLLAQFHQLSQQADSAALSKCQQEIDNQQAWDLMPKIELMATRLGLDVNLRLSDLSGGMIRRVLLAAALISEPDLLLLDEPTNHLDIASIEWLEAYLKQYRGSLLLITHDRTFLEQVASKIVEIDRGQLRTFDCGYEQYLERREAIRLAEDKQDALFDKRLAEEEVWIRTGVKARRTRNEGRVRALKVMREAWKSRRAEQGKVKGLQVSGQQSGQLVLEAENLCYNLEDRCLIQPLSLLLMRGDKLGIIGPNGCGKTTLVRLLLGQLPVTAGSLKSGTGLDIAYFDQLRSQLNLNDTVMQNVGEGADHVIINGKRKHVASYLKEFLFSPEKFNQQVSTLSGGERNRLLLAKLLAKPVNFLVLDEPTNDLDIETLELLESILIEYSGTMILISHDRAFINQVVTSVLVYEEDGIFNEYVGGFDDYQRVKKQQKEPQRSLATPASPAKKSLQTEARSDKLSYNEQRELKSLPAKIEVLEETITELHDLMTASDYYQNSADILAKDKQKLDSLEASLAVLYIRWETLEGKG